MTHAMRPSTLETLGLLWTESAELTLEDSSRGELFAYASRIDRRTGVARIGQCGRCRGVGERRRPRPHSRQTV